MSEHGRSGRSQWMALMAGLLALVLVLCAASLTAGKVWVPLHAWRLGGDDPLWAIIVQLRAPRTLLAVIIGAALGLSGATLQGYTRNPLADPGVLGVSSMAGLGAVSTIYFGLGVSAPWTLPVFAIVAAGVGVVALLLLAGAAGGVVTFLLAGVILNTMAVAGVSLALSLAPDPWASSQILDWLMGSLADRSMGDVELCLPFVVLGAAMLLATSPALDALTLGETGARAVGVSLRRTQALIAVGTGLACGASVAVAGAIGFVGLITPHLIRPMVGARPGALLAPSAVAGSALLLSADILVRLTPQASEVKLGVAMAALGGPFFLVLLLARRRRLT